MGTRAKKVRLTHPVEALTRSQIRLIKAVDFSRLDPIELSTYLRYEVGREIVRQEAIVRPSPHGKKRSYVVDGLLEPPSSPKVPMKFGEMPRTRTRKKIWQDEDWLASRVKLIRKTCHLGKEFVTRIPGNPLWFLHPPTRILCLWPEWPGKSYFAIPIQERLRRIKVFAEITETDRLAQCAYLLNPLNPSTTKIAIVTIAILAAKSATYQQQEDSYKALLSIYAPALKRTSPTKKRGRGSKKIRIIDDLNSFAAHLLCTVGKIRSTQALQYIRCPKSADHQWSRSEPAYQSGKKLLAAARRFCQHLQGFRAELMANLVPLGPPLAPWETLLQPDWDQLDAAIDAHPEPWQGALTDLEAIEQTDLDETARKALQDKVLQDIARLDQEFRRMGLGGHQVVLKNITSQLEEIFLRTPHGSSPETPKPGL